MSVSNFFNGENMTFGGKHLDMQNKSIVNLADPVEDHHVATKKYIDSVSGVSEELSVRLDKIDDKITVLEYPDTYVINFPINEDKYNSCT